MLIYSASIELSARTLRRVAGLITAHRRSIRSRWRRLNPGRQALLALAYLRCGQVPARLAEANGIGVSTVHRYLAEVIDLLAADAPDLATAVKVAARKAFVLLDGTLIPIDRIAAARPFYSGKHKKHGMNVQVIADPAGRLIWASPALPGAVHDVRAAREHGIVAALADVGVLTFADKAYRGAGGTVSSPFYGRDLPEGPRAVNRSQAKIRALVEPAVATLKRWKVLTKVRCCPYRTTALVAAILTLELGR